MDGIQYYPPWCFRIFPIAITPHYSHHLNLNLNTNLIGNLFADTFATHILDAKYKQANIHIVFFDQHHLSLDQQRNLFNIKSKHKILFDGSLGAYPHKKFHIDLKQGAKPVHHCTYPVPHIHQQTFKKKSITWSSLASLHHAEPLNGHPRPLLSPKRWSGTTNYQFMLTQRSNHLQTTSFAYHHRHAWSHLWIQILH